MCPPPPQDLDVCHWEAPRPVQPRRAQHQGVLRTSRAAPRRATGCAAPTPAHTVHLTRVCAHHPSLTPRTMQPQSQSLDRLGTLARACRDALCLSYPTRQVGPGMLLAVDAMAGYPFTDSLRLIMGARVYACLLLACRDTAARHVCATCLSHQQPRGSEGASRARDRGGAVSLASRARAEPGAAELLLAARVCVSPGAPPSPHHPLILMHFLPYNDSFFRAAPFAQRAVWSASCAWAWPSSSRRR